MRKALCGALLVLAVSCAGDQKRVTSALAAEHYHAGEWGFFYLPPGVSVDCGARPAQGIAARAGCVEATEEQQQQACDVPETKESCRAYSRAINRLRKEADLSNETQKIGKLPPAARKQLKAYAKCAERRGQCPEISRPASAKP